jgi:hypothetical protein
MLGSITPLGERGRNMSFRVTMTAFGLGAAAGGGGAGATLGGLGRLLAGAVPGGQRAALGALAAALAAGALLETGVAGLRLPTPRRQVDERWLQRYRGWVYGAGFGLQLGLGVVTVVTSAAIYAAFLAALLCESVVRGLAIGLAFGAARAAVALPAARVRSVDGLLAADRLLRAWERPARRAVLAVEAGVALVSLAVLV